MSLDPLSLGLAAAMPVLVFVLYLGLRSLRERRSLRRATVRPPKNGVPRQLAGRPDVATAGAFTPTALPLPATPEVRGGVLAKVQAVRPMAEVRTRPSGEMSL